MINSVDSVNWPLLKSLKADVSSLNSLLIHISLPLNKHRVVT